MGILFLFWSLIEELPGRLLGDIVVIVIFFLSSRFDLLVYLHLCLNFLLELALYSFNEDFYLVHLSLCFDFMQFEEMSNKMKMGNHLQCHAFR